MKRIQFFLLIIIAFSSCKKASEEDFNNAPKGCQLTEFGGGSIYNIKLEYDEIGRISKVYTPNFEGGYDIDKYYFEDNKILVKHKNYTKEFHLQNGKIVEGNGFRNSSGIQPLIDISKYSYSSNNQLNQFQFQVNNDIKFKDKLSYINSNYIKSEFEMNSYKTEHFLTSGSGQYFPFNLHYLTQSSSAEIFFVNFTNNVLYEMGYFGEKSKNEFLSFSDSNRTTKTFSKVLEKDNYGNVTKIQIKKEGEERNIYNVEFIYTCK